MEESVFNKLPSKTEVSDHTTADEPQITSIDPEERILARRLRIQKRNAAARKRLQAIEDGKESSSESDQEETILEKQVEKSTIELLTLADEGREMITNVRVAADSHEVKRRSENEKAKQARIKKLEEEARIAQEKFDQINSKWENITLLKDPLELHHETEMQRDKCKNLIAQKDQLIAELKAELMSGDVRFIKDQQKQEEDISLLVERIDSQIAIMRRAYRRELILIEQAIDTERKEMVEINNKRWEALYRQREEDEINNMEQRFVALSEHNQLMQDILIHHQEKYRATKISLEKDIQVLQQQLEQVKAVCLLNKEKMEYNYQVLKKRDEESLLIRSQQKRRINKLQDIVTTLRRKILDMEQSTHIEVKRLTSEVIKLHRNIKDILFKAEHFCSVNEDKYFQLWKFNHDSAQKLLNKILSIDRLIHEQQLGIPWQPSLPKFINKKDLPSYKIAIGKNSIEKSYSGEEEEDKISDIKRDQLIKHILESVADRSGFLMEERLNILLAPYTRAQNTLVLIDNVFNALGVSRQDDIELLRKIMEPYIICATCNPILHSDHPLTPPVTPHYTIFSEEKFKDHVIDQVREVIEGNKKHSKRRGTKQTQLGLSGEALGQDINISEGESYTVTVAERSLFSLRPTTTLSRLMKSKQSIELTTPELSSHKHHSTLSLTRDSPTVLTKDKEPEKTIKTCSLPSHEKSINRVCVLKALREFVEEFQSAKERNDSLPWSKNKDEKVSVSRQLSDEDVRIYWEQFRTAFSGEKEKLWDCLYLGMQQYHTVLQERHKINSDIENLKLQNAELRRLLQKYALPNNMKPVKGAHHNLPPLSDKQTPPAPASTPARLILTFNNSSRV